MRRLRKVLLWLLAVVFAIPVLAVAALFAALNTAPGQGLAARAIQTLTGGAVTLDGLSGRFPDHLRLAHLELHDTGGAYLTADDVALDWSPTALLHKQALVHRLTARTLDFARLPAADAAAKPAPPDPNAKPFQLPVRVTVEHLAIPAAHLGAPLLGTAAVASLEGQADLPTLATGTARLAIARTDKPGAYTFTGTLTSPGTGAGTGDAIDAHLAVTEPEGGLVAHLASLPAIGPLAIEADVAGPRAALATTLALSAGPLAAHAAGTVDLDHDSLALDVRADAPAMQPAPGIAWRGVALSAHVTGPFTAPDATGHLQVDDLQAQGAAVQTLTAELAGNAGHVTLHAVATALRVPGPKPALLAAAPLTLDAAIRLDDPARPLTFRLGHPLLMLQGTARTAGALQADAVLALPDLAPLAAAANVDLAGHTSLNLHAAQPRAGVTSFAADGTLALTAGPAPAPALLGPDAKLAVAGQVEGDTVTLGRATVDGAAVSLEASGRKGADGVDVAARLGLANLALLAPTLTGAATLDAHAYGPLDRLALDAAVAGDVGAPGVPTGPVSVKANLTGLPAEPTGHLVASGTLEGAPLEIDVNATRDPAGVLHASIGRADWRSLHAEGALALEPGATLPQGHVALRVPRLADLRPLIGQPLAGGLTATLDLDHAAATLEAELRNAGLPGIQVGRAQLKAHVADPLGHRVLAATLSAEEIDAAGTTGSARIEANGPQEALAVRTTANLVASGTPAQITAAALLDLAAKQVRLNALQVDAKPPGLSSTGLSSTGLSSTGLSSTGLASTGLASTETVRLLGPATVRFGGPVTVDRLRLGLRQATLDVAGQLSPTLNATVSLKANATDLPLPAAAGQGTGQAYEGAFTLDAKLDGSPAAPTGTVRLNATGLHARSGPAASLPRANLAATARLQGHAARIDARATAGSATVAVTGTAPIGAGSLDLHATAALDLALLDPILTAQGRRLQGRLSLDATATGPAAAPRLAGQAQLTGGDLQDFTQGVHIANLAATVRAEGQTLRITSLTGRAGPGTVAASGTVGVLAPGLPVDLTVTLRNARPLASDTITANLDADLTVRGTVEKGLAAAGHVLVRSASLGIPDTLPASVAVLPVRRPGDKPVAPAAPGAPIGLDLVIDAPGQVFVRGRGLDAEMAGKLTIRGTSTSPQVAGGLDMRRGDISVAGTTLTFTHGRVGFDGTGVTGKIDPTLDFAAESTSAGVTATLAITGYVSKPKITLSSTPDLPQDEVLAYLIFKRSAKDLGPFQIAEIAAGLAQLSGVGGAGGINPLESVRKGLGLDRLSVGTTTTSGSTAAANTSSPTVEGGRYVANGIYVGAKQGTTGNQTQATVQIDIAKGLKAETDVGTGQGANQVGVTYQFEY